MEYIVRYGECAYGPYSAPEAYAVEREIKAYSKARGIRAKVLVVPIKKWETTIFSAIPASAGQA